MKKSSKRIPVGQWLGYAALLILAIISIGPLWIAVKTALSGPTAWLTSAGSLVPHETTLFNFQRVLGFVDASDPRLTQAILELHKREWRRSTFSGRCSTA